MVELARLREFWDLDGFGVGATPMMLAIDAIICASTGGAIASAYGHECPRSRRESIRVFGPAMYPPEAPKDLVNVPIKTSIKPGWMLK
jgi:hypothetical protein